MSPKSTFRANWRGAELMRRLRSASEKGIDDTMAAATIDAKAFHPGWKNQTGNAEGNTKIRKPAEQDVRGVVGIWGSEGVNYMLNLEINHGSALRMSAQENYPSLGRRIAFHLRGVI